MKNIGKLILAAAILMIFAVQANAQSNTTANQPAQKQAVANSSGGNYVDKDNNGVCDNIGTRSGNGRGANFVDKNNDGICDNRATAGKKTGNNCRNGNGNQHRHGQGQGRGNCCRR
ncbi:MAG: hypothetical protein WCI92_11200 [Bacteroidota bacterium]